MSEPNVKTDKADESEDGGMSDYLGHENLDEGITQNVRFSIADSLEKAREHYREAIAAYRFLMRAWCERHPDGKYATLDDMPPGKPSGVYLIDEAVVMFVHDKYHYMVSWDRFNKRYVEKSMLWWINHLAGKNWFTRSVLRGFIYAVYKHFGIVREYWPELPEE